jgi:hypothetical protein
VTATVVLAGTRRLASRVAGAATVAALALVLAVATVADAASPSPGVGGDPRSDGQGPGLVGDPGTAILLVLAIGLVSLGATLLYVRLTDRARPRA